MTDHTTALIGFTKLGTLDSGTEYWEENENKKEFRLVFFKKGKPWKVVTPQDIEPNGKVHWTSGQKAEDDEEL